MEKKLHYTRLKFFLALVSLLFSYSADAMDDQGYYWYNNHVSAYPIGKGLVYATEDREYVPTDADYKDDMTLRFYTDSSSSSIYVYGKPVGDYQLVGWYWAKDGKIDTIVSPCLMDENMVEFGDILSPPLKSTNSEDNIEEHYSDEDLNDILVVFGKVRTDLSLDMSMYMFEDTPEMNLSMILLTQMTYQYLKPSINIPANDVGDVVEISTLTSYTDYLEKDTFYVDLDYSERVTDYDMPNNSIDFQYWTDSKGNKIYDPCFSITVTEKETYTAYYRLTHYGDANSDCTIDVTDISSIAAFILEQETSPCNTTNADANADGNIDVADIANVASRILGAQ